MNGTWMALACSLAVTGGASAALLPLQEAQKKAEAENKPIVLLWSGSDWMQGADALQRKWTALSESNAAPVVWALFDETTKTTPDELKAAGLPVEVWNLPVALVMTPQKKLVAQYSPAVASNPALAAKKIESAVATAQKQEGLLKKAASATGRDKARLIGKALDSMELIDAVSRKDLLDELGKADPQDETGYVFKYALGAMPKTPGAVSNLYKKVNELMTEGGKKKGRERDFSAADRFLAEKLTAPVLDTPQKQQLLAARAYVAREKYRATGGAGVKNQMLSFFRDIYRLDRKSELGKGARGYVEYFTKPILLNGLDFEPVHLRKEFHPWTINATKYVTAPGTYEITRVHDGGPDSVSVRNARILVNGKLVAELPADQRDKDRDSFELTLPELKPGSRVQVEMDARGNGYWLSTWGHIEINKK